MGDKKLLLKVGEKIKTVRTGKNKTQNELAMDCGFDKAAISRIESGQSNITMRSLKIDL
jgi:transcriptional regulator with XRE-family HTH domain